MENYCRKAERNWNVSWPRITAHKRSLLVFSSFGFVFTNKSYLSGKYSFRLVATSPVRGTLPAIIFETVKIPTNDY